MPGSKRTPPSMPPLLAVGLLSAAVLAYEVLLMRLFAVVHWHHFAFMMISVALLGYGASGTFLSLIPSLDSGRLRFLFPAVAAGFSLTSVLCFTAAQQMPFNALEIFWDGRQWVYLAGIYGLLLIPFFLAATGIGAIMRFYNRLIPKIYACDLVGAGMGAAMTAGFLLYLPPQTALWVVAGAGALAAATAAWHWKIKSRRAFILAIMGLIVLTGLVAVRWGRLEINPYKPLAQILRIPETQRLHEEHHPMGWFSAVASTGVPFRYAPGLSLTSNAPIPEQVAFFVDAKGMSVADRYHGGPDALNYLQQSTLSLGFHLRSRADRVLIAGAGGGQDILRAHLHGARQIDAVDAHPLYARMLAERLPEFSGWSLLEGDVRYHSTTVRAFLGSAAGDFDVIQLSLAGDGRTGARAFGENTLLTIEGLGQMWRQLRADGLLVMPLWIRLPPRGCLKAFLLALQMLERQGVHHPARHLAVIRDTRTAVLLVGKSALHSKDRDAVRQFCRQWAFDLVYLADLRPEEANRHNVLARPMFAEGTRRLSGRDREGFVARYKFDLQTPTDDRPFFDHFFRWQSLPEIAALRKAGGVALLDWGYPVLLATLLQATVFSLVLIGLPVWWHRRRTTGGTGERPGMITVLLYFGAIGGGFILLEMVFIQRLSLFLHHPLLAATLTLAGFLLGAGGGSIGASTALRHGWKASTLLRISLVAVLALGLLQIAIMPRLIQHFIGTALGLKVLIALGLILPLAVGLGMAFPLGIAVVAANHPRVVPWAWGINGCATVTGAIAVPLLAIHLGYAMTAGLALVLYAVGLTVTIWTGD